jgi:curved DNA-binding protein CbpA
MITHYDVLKVSPNASLTVITEAYNALCKKYHPDNYQDEIKRAKAESVIKRLDEAFEILSDKKKRDDYDLKLKFIEDTDVILKDEKISSESKQTDTNEGVLKKINFDKIKENISQSVDNVKTEIQHSINETITSKVDLEKVKGSIAQSVGNAKTLAEKIEHSVHEKIENINFDAIKSEIKDKIHTLDSNAEKKSSEDMCIDDDFYKKIISETELIEHLDLSDMSNLNQDYIYLNNSLDDCSSPLDQKLTNCEACEREISILATTCPGCGSPNNWIHPNISHFIAIKNQIKTSKEFNVQWNHVAIWGETKATRTWWLWILILFLMLVTFILFYLLFLYSSAFIDSPEFGLLSTLSIVLFALWVIFDNPNSDRCYKKKEFIADFHTGSWWSSDDKFWLPVRKVLRI